MSYCVIKIWHGDHLSRKVRLAQFTTQRAANEYYEEQLEAVRAEAPDYTSSNTWDHMVFFNEYCQIVRESA